MNSATLELALRKQRLQIAGEGLRAEFGESAARLRPLFHGADYAVEGFRWMRRNPELVVAGAAAFVVIRPRSAWRWARRAFVGWQLWRNFRNRLLERERSLFRNW